MKGKTMADVLFEFWRSFSSFSFSATQAVVWTIIGLMVILYKGSRHYVMKRTDFWIKEYDAHSYYLADRDKEKRNLGSTFGFAVVCSTMIPISIYFAIGSYLNTQVLDAKVWITILIAPVSFTASAIATWYEAKYQWRRSFEPFKKHCLKNEALLNQKLTLTTSKGKEFTL